MTSSPATAVVAPSLAVEAAVSVGPDAWRTPTRFVESGDVRLAVYTRGAAPSAKRPRPTVLLVHGYPDSAEVWADVAERLSKQFHVVAYDVRGAGQSDKPRATAAYALEHLVADMAAVVDAMSPNAPVHLVGHDWGALQGWEAVGSERLRGRIASYCAGTPSLDHVGNWFQQRLRRPTPRALGQVVSQMFGSAYMGVFQIPLLPDLAWRHVLGRRWPAFLKRTEGIRAARTATQAADGEHGLALYRANLLPKFRRPQRRVIEIPVQLMVMRRDPYVPTRMFEAVAETTPNLSRFELDAGHWAPLSNPQGYADGIAAFVTSIEGK